MLLFNIFFIAIALGIDAFSIAVVAGVCFSSITIKQRLNLSFHFGFFQFGMTIIGYFIGSYIASYIEAIDHWVILLLLGFVGIKLIKDSLNKRDEKELQIDFFSEKNLLMLAFITSIDALAIGLSFALIGQAILFPAVIIGIITILMTMIGVSVGNIFSNISSKMQIIAGVVLILIGIHIFLEHKGIL